MASNQDGKYPMADQDLGVLHIDEEATLRVMRGKGIEASVIRAAELRAVVTRADGRVEDLGVVARYERTEP